MRGAALSLLTVVATCAAPAGLRAQEAGADAEREAVRKVVETYLYAEDSGEKRPVADAAAKVYAVDASRGRVTATPLSSPPRKTPKGAKTPRSPQRVASIEVLGDGASAKVATDFTPDDPKDEANTHYQLIWLLKVRGEWKIVGVLMPTPARPPAGR